MRRLSRIAPIVAVAAMLGSIVAGLPAHGASARATDATTRAQQTMQLISFNGMYDLAGTTSGFVLVDANMTKSVEHPDPQYTVSLIVSLDGTSSHSVPFTGSFDGAHLRQSSSNGTKLDLTFTRRIHRLGSTAAVKGQVTLPGAQPIAVSGVTYDNPIEADFWNGQTFYMTPATPGRAPILVARIDANGDLYYDYGRNSGRLTRVPAYNYNLDMYYYTFPVSGGGTASFIMGTSGNQGLAMNNLTVKADEPISARSLNTIPRGKAPSTKTWYPDFHLTQGPTSLAIGAGTTITDFSAYYPISDADNTTSSKAFFAISGYTLSLAPGIEQTVAGAKAGSLYSALITVSLDGKTTRNFYFDTSAQMSFDGHTLRMPKQRIQVTFAREYNPNGGSVFRMEGTIGAKKVRGSSPFNPVPITAFAATMKDVTGKNTLVVSPTGAITLNGQELANYEYVPSMYIVAGPIPGTTLSPQPVTLLSLGHAGASGISAIVTTNYGTPQASTFNMFQIAP